MHDARWVRCKTGGSRVGHEWDARVGSKKGSTRSTNRPQEGIEQCKIGVSCKQGRSRLGHGWGAKVGIKGGN